MAKKKQGDGSVFQRKDGRWEGRIVVGYKENGYAQTKNVTARTKTECQEKLAKLREECGRRSEKIKPDMPFGDWIDFWYQNYSAPKLRPTTQACYSGRIYTHIIPSIGSIPLNKLTQNDLQQFYARLKKSGRKKHVDKFGEGLSDRMVKSCHVTCRMALDKAVEDLQKLDKLMWDRYGYQITLHRPPHYVDKMQDGFTSYDVCDKMGYQYMAASFDGAGWLPSTLSDPEAALEAEVNAMVEPMRKALEKDPDFFCGQIIFQKDGYNMGKRTPVAFGLRKQLELLKEYGYQVVTVDTLLAESPFADLGRDDPLFEKLNKLQQERAVVYSDNCLRLDAVMTCGELAMLLAPKEEALGRRWAAVRRSGKHENAYWGAMDWCAEQGLLPRGTKPDAPVTALPEGLFAPVSDFTRRSVYGAYKNQ